MSERTQSSDPPLDQLLILTDRSAILRGISQGIAHDLRGPLQAMMLVGQPAGSPEEEAEIAAAVSKAVRTMADIVKRFAQIYAAPAQEPAPLIVDELIAFVQDVQRFQRGLPAVRLEVRVPRSLPAVRGKESDLRHLLLSLLVNAKEAVGTRGDGRITLTAAAANGGVEIVVEDNGPGIPAEDRERIFEAFYSTKPGETGLGLGLAVARLLVAESGGRVWAEAGPGGRLIVLLPGWSGESELARGS